MKKKLLSLVIVAGSFLFLTACSSVEEQMAGTYYEYYETDKGTIISSIDNIVISGDTMFKDLGDVSYEIDFDDETLISDKGIETFRYEDDVFSFDGKNYVKIDSKKYDELIADGATLSE